MYYQKQKKINEEQKLEMKLLLICDGAGNIVFSEGDQRVFRLSHAQMLHTNLYDIGLTVYSQLLLTNTLDSLQFKKDKITTIYLQTIRSMSGIAENLNFQIKIEANMKSLIKKIFVQVQEIDVKFQNLKMSQRLMKLKKKQKTIQKKNQYNEDTLYMFEIQQIDASQMEIQSNLYDYNIIKERFIQKKAQRMY